MPELPLQALLIQCFSHFYHEDLANAAVHMAPVRYSPITFRLAERLHAMSNVSMPEVQRVLDDRGTYEEDKGRA